MQVLGELCAVVPQPRGSRLPCMPCQMHCAASSLHGHPTPAVLIVASFFPPVYFGFMCAPWTRLFYLTTTSLLGEPARHARRALPAMQQLLPSPA